MRLTTPFYNFIVWSGRKIRLNLSYDTVLMVYEIWQDGLFTDADKVELCLNILCRGWRSKRLVRACKWQERGEILAAIFQEHINTQKQNSASREQVFDFAQDAEYIYASFMLDYGIDLIAEQGRLDWRKFIALFSGLSERTKMREIISIRSRKIPSPTKYNADEIAALKEAKAFYALKSPFSDKEANFEQGLTQLFNILKARATQ